MRGFISENASSHVWSVFRLTSIKDWFPSLLTCRSKLSYSLKIRRTRKPVQALYLLTFILILSSCSTRSIEIEDLGYANKYLGNLNLPVRSNRISSKFGPRRGRLHTGIDIPAPRGTAVFATHDGEVIHSGRYMSGYGTTVIVKDNNFLTLYAHLSHTLLTRGRKVRAGDPIGEVGATGNATGNHLHFETRIITEDGRSVAVNPEHFLKRF